MSKKLLLILFAILLGAAQPLEAQRRNPAKSADTAFERGQYSLAIERYKKAIKKVKKKKFEDERNRITYQMGECYRLTDNAKQAAAQYKRLMKSDFPNSNPIFYLLDGLFITLDGEAVLTSLESRVGTLGRATTLSLKRLRCSE